MVRCSPRQHYCVMVAHAGLCKAMKRESARQPKFTSQEKNGIQCNTVLCEEPFGRSQAKITVTIES
eukprot:1186878-Prorocentrum_minimum.AAC.7